VIPVIPGMNGSGNCWIENVTFPLSNL